MTKFQPVKGMRDFLPEEMARRQFVLDTIRRVFESWGYGQLDTPALESFELLAKKGGGGEEIKREIYCFVDQGGRELGLRFDLTVPTARVIASNPNLPKPFKRYQFGKVWRYDEPQAGRYREFVQTDIDIFGVAGPEADAEIIAATCDVFQALGFKDFIIRLNNRAILEDFIKGLGIKEPIEVFRSIDKLDKIGIEGVKKELEKKGLKEKTINEISKFIVLRGGTEVIEKYKNLNGTGSLKLLMNKLSELGYEKNIAIDFSLVRGLEYYTSYVFEVGVSGGKWSLAGGGRFDNLVELFGGSQTPATGISLGFERILVIMEQEKMFEKNKEFRKNNIFAAAVNDSVRKDAAKIAAELRKSGLSCQTDLLGRNLKKQLEYANSTGCAFVVFVGPEELKKNSVKVRDMKSGKEDMVKIEGLEKFFRKN